MFFFKLVLEEKSSKDCFMKQKPFNDNLIMASIKNLYEQASHTVGPNSNGLRRHNLRDLPIIGSLPVQIGQHEGANEYDDVVLTGRLHAASADDNRTTIVAETDSDKEQEANPFLEIRQAVIAAGNNNNQKLERLESSARKKSNPNNANMSACFPTVPDEQVIETMERSFAKHLANLIDAEIERRMAVRLHPNKKPSNKKTSATQTTQKYGETTTKLKKTKKKAVRKPATKKPSTTKRIKPK